ncbi:MAG: hypothetical protein Fur0042_22530 [Cyanophyceae cyanobacterium]
MSISVSSQGPVPLPIAVRSPVFSVVVGTADPLAIGEAIAGLRQQTLTAWEAITFRDPQGSAQGGEGRVRWLDRVDLGDGSGERHPGVSSYDLNRAIAIARGPWVVVLGSGDHLATVETLERMGESLAANPSWDGCLTNWTWRGGDRVARLDDGPWGPAPGIGVRPDRPWGTVWLARSALVRLGGLDETRGASALADGVQRLMADGGRLGHLRRSPLVADPVAVRAPLADPGVVVEFESIWTRSQPHSSPMAIALPYLQLAWGQYQGGHAIAAAQTLARTRDRQSCQVPQAPALTQWVETFQRLAQQDGIKGIDAAIAPFPWPLAPLPIQTPTPKPPSPAHRPLGFVLYRILGNDLPPRHQAGQTLNNLRFILRHEPPLEGCEKRWVVNRIVDRDLEAAILAELERHGQPYLHLPFDEAVYATLPFGFDGFTEPNFFRSRAFTALNPVSQALAIDHAYRLKNQYVMHNNGGRNGALREGRSRGRWILPWDGNCFLTAAAWRAIRTTIAQVDAADGDGCQYAIVPMARLASNEQLLDPHFIPAPVEEPQIAFRYDAPEIFDPERRYGRMPKVELLRRLQIPGPWDGWSWYPWEKPAPPPVPAGDRAVVGGWVVRLASGNPHSEADADQRRVDRGQGILGLLDDLDDRLTAQGFSPRSRLLPDLWEGLGRDRGSLPIPERPEPWPAFPPGHGLVWVRFHDGVLCQENSPEAIATRAELPNLLKKLQEEKAAQEAAADLGAVGSAWVVQVATIALHLGEFKTARWTLATGILTRPFPAVPVDAIAGDAVGEANFWDVVDRLVAVRLGQRIGLDLWTARGWGGQAIAAAAMEWIQAFKHHGHSLTALGDRVALIDQLIQPLQTP